MGIRRVTSFRQEAADWAKFRKYVHRKGLDLTVVVETLLAPACQAIDGMGPDPLAGQGRPLAGTTPEADE